MCSLYFLSARSADGHVCGSVHFQPATGEHDLSLDLRELVLDVPQGTAVLLKRKVWSLLLCEIVQAFDQSYTRPVDISS